MASARPFPPSSQRIAEARRAGHVPTVPLAGFVCALLFVLGAGSVLGPRFLAACLQLLSALELVASGQSSRAHALVATTLQQLALVSAVALVLGFLGIVLGRLLTQGVSFASLSSSRTRFAALTPSRTASTLWCLGLCLLTLLTLSGWTRFDRTTVASLASDFASQLALLSVACLVIDSAFARARFFASLWLTRREHLDEQREAFGAPELRAARQRARAQT